MTPYRRDRSVVEMRQGVRGSRRTKGVAPSLQPLTTVEPQQQTTIVAPSSIPARARARAREAAAAAERDPSNAPRRDEHLVSLRGDRKKKKEKKKGKRRGKNRASTPVVRGCCLRPLVDSRCDRGPLRISIEIEIDRSVDRSIDRSIDRDRPTQSGRFTKLISLARPPRSIGPRSTEAIMVCSDQRRRPARGGRRQRTGGHAGRGGVGCVWCPRRCVQMEAGWRHRVS